MNNKILNFNFYGLKFSSFELDELKEDVINTVTSGLKKVYFGYSLGSLPYFRKYPVMAEISNKFDVMLTDGRGMFLLVKYSGYPVKCDISIPNFTKLVLEIANEKRMSVMIIGSSPENNSNAVLNTRKKYKNAVIYDGHHGGDFSEKEQKITVDKINKAEPDILLVGVSSPKKEVFVKNWKDRLNVKIIIPFGGAIDILSGKSKPIPKIIKKLCLGGFYRFFQEPRRLFRDSILYVANVIFLFFPVFIYKVFLIRDENFCIPHFYNKNYNCEEF